MFYTMNDHTPKPISKTGKGEPNFDFNSENCELIIHIFNYLKESYMSLVEQNFN